MAKAIPWSSDRTVGKSSLRVLLDWIKEGDNYARWSRGRVAKTILCNEILQLMDAQGITYRKEADVRAKIWALEKNMAVIRKLLAQKGFHGVYSLKDCDEGIRNKISRRCAYFEELARVMFEPNTGQPIQPRRGRPRLITSRSEAEANESIKTDAKDDTPKPSAPAPITTDECSAVNAAIVSTAGGDLIALQRAEIQERIDQQRLKHQIELRKIQMEFETASIQSQMARERSTMELLAARAIERQKMRTSGIQPEDVDRLMPEA